jgi:hypothetical protein
MADDKDKPEDPAHMGFSDLISLCLQLNGRLDQLWQRVLYAHAAIVGVMVFFASTENLYAIPRLLVFAFYTANTLITVFAFTETLMGLKAVVADLKVLQGGSGKTAVQAWVFARNYDRHAAIRMAILAITWALLAYLLIVPLVCGDGPLTSWACTTPELLAPGMLSSPPS